MESFTVKDFIKILKHLNQDAEICVLLDKIGWETRGEIPILCKKDRNGVEVEYAIDGRLNK